MNTYTHAHGYYLNILCSLFKNIIFKILIDEDTLFENLGWDSGQGVVDFL